MSLARAATVFALAGAVTLVAGIVLERSGERIASHVGLSGVIFGATILAAATALPEISTGIAVGEARRLPARRLRHLRRQRVPAGAVPAREPALRLGRLAAGAADATST